MLFENAHYFPAKAVFPLGDLSPSVKSSESFTPSQLPGHSARASTATHNPPDPPGSTRSPLLRGEHPRTQARFHRAPRLPL